MADTPSVQAMADTATAAISNRKTLAQQIDTAVAAAAKGLDDQRTIADATYSAPAPASPDVATTPP
jgi:hypothetical protein